MKIISTRARVGDPSDSKNASLQVSEGKISAMLSETETCSARYSMSANKYAVPNNCKQTLTEETSWDSKWWDLVCFTSSACWTTHSDMMSFTFKSKVLKAPLLNIYLKQWIKIKQVAKSFVQYLHGWITHQNAWLLMATRCPAKEKETKNYLINPVVLHFCKQLNAGANNTNSNLNKKKKNKTSKGKK